MQVIPFQLTGGFLVKLAVVKIFGYPKFEYPELTRPNKWVELTSWASNFLSTEMLNLCSTNLLNQPKFLGTLALSLGSRGELLSSILFMAYCLWKAKSSHFPSRSVSQPTTTPLLLLLWSLFVYMPKWIFATSAQCTHWSFVHWIIFMHLLYLVRGVVVGLSCWVSSPLFACRCLKSSWFSWCHSILSFI